MLCLDSKGSGPLDPMSIAGGNGHSGVGGCCVLSDDVVNAVSRITLS